MRILIVSNGSNGAVDSALSFGLWAARRVDEVPTVLKVVDRRVVKSPSLDVSTFNACQAKPESDGLQTRVRFGPWGDEIIRETQEREYDLVILGEKHAPGLAPAHRKSQAVQITERVPCPVLVIKGPVEKVQRILLCDSGAAYLATLSRFAEKVRELFNECEGITVLHVMSQISAGPGVPGKQLRADAAALIHEHALEGNLLLKDIQALEICGFHPVPKIRHGLVLDEILCEVKDGNYDLVVIGSHRYDGLQGYLLDNLARKLITRLDQSVLVLK
jgi:nucleotide-binding universal stress UspA family protein